MKQFFTIILSLIFVNITTAQNLTATLIDQSVVSDSGLFFDGTRYDEDTNPTGNYRFGNRITPHGDCIDVVNGYVFVTWYKGGMDERSLMLSRKNLTDPAANWVTIEFPHKHIGWRGIPTIGDSHNTAAIGVSTIDGTIHLIYDLHAYSSNSYPNDFFNYSVSVKDAAFQPDAAFNLDLFKPKQNYLKAGENYERLTYPALRRAADGSLVVRYRTGGAGNGDILLATYDGNAWSNNWLYSDGTIPLPNRYSLYGSEKYIHDTFYSCFSVRFAQNENYSLNSGLYFAYTNAVLPTPSSQWFDANGNSISLPIQNPAVIKIAEPSDDYGTATAPRISLGPAFTVTKNGAIHMITRVDNINVHYYKLAEDAEFSSSQGGLIPNPQVRGGILSFNDRVFMVELVGRKPVIKSTLEGQNDWQIIYSAEAAPTRFKHFNSVIANDKLYVYLMEDTDGDACPLHLQVFSLSGGTPTSTSEEILPAEVTVYPNPNKGIFDIKSKSRISSYAISSVQGKVLQSGKLNFNQLDISDFPAGVYFLELSANNKNMVKKIVIE
ncbi:MAG: BNR-4 repeat-containing protein [Saprospiraceae bacterium]